MNTPTTNAQPVSSGGATRVIEASSVLLFRNGSVLLIRRGKGANKGRWSAPGGHLDAGETHEDAARRELLEETGIVAGELAAVTTHRVSTLAEDSSKAQQYVITVFTGITPSDCHPQAGSDAAEAHFVPICDVATLPVTEGLTEIISACQSRVHEGSA